LIPAIRPSPEEVEPIGVRRTGNTGAPGSPSNGQKPISPEDAPVLLLSSRPGAAPTASQSLSEPGHESPGGRTSPSDPMSGTRRSLEAYQRQLQGMMDSLAQGTTLAGQGGGAGLNTASVPSSGLTGGAVGATPSMPTGLRAGSGSAGLFGGELSRSSTPRVSAGQLGDRNLILPKGTSFTCALKTRVVSATSGLIGCQVQRNVYSDSGRVLLIERGSHLDGEYRMTTVRPGTVRIPVLWTRLRTPNGVTVDIDSPGTGPLGESGIDGHVDNRWGERIGAALLLSVIDDAVRLVIQNQSSEGGDNTVILQSTTGSANKLAEKVLDSTINIPPLIYQNQGGIVGIYVARDVDFGGVYQLESTDAGGAR
jgi:type IV secretion system protein VirB10